MSLRIVRMPQPRISKTDVLRITLTMSTLATELSKLSAFPPVIAATSILLLILQTVQSVENNREACAGLAKRCAQILLDLNDVMRDKWDTAPPSLLRNLAKYTETLGAVHTFMKAQANEKWTKRLFRKASIEAALIDFDRKLCDSTQMFQTAMLIDIILIHKADVPYLQSNGDEISSKQDVDSEQLPAYESKQNTLDEQSIAQDNAQDGVPDVTPTVEDTEDADDVLISDAVLEDHGFRRYHQSQVRPTGRSKIKSGWWADTAIAEVDGQSTLVKYYKGNSKNDAIKAWLHDVKKLQNLFHPNFPHMTGYSDGHSPTPFILLSDIRTNAPDKIMSHTLRNEGVAACLNLLARYYNDIADATAYVQRQFNMPENQVQDFVEKTSFRVGASNTIIMGLPPARKGDWMILRNSHQGLSYSLMQTMFNMLPGGGYVQLRLRDYLDVEADEDPLKVAHLVLLARCLLSNEHSSGAPLVTKLLEKDDDFEDFGDERKFSMKELRQHSLEAGVHDFFWSEMSAIPPHKFAVGDFGHIPRTATFADFVKLGNIYSDNLANLPITAHTRGSQFCSEDRFPQYVEIQKFPLPLDAYCWPIAVPPGAQINCQIEHSESIGDTNEAWRFLSSHAKQLAVKFNVAPEDLILITTAGTNQYFYIKDYSANNLFRPSSTGMYYAQQFHPSSTGMYYAQQFHHHSFANMGHTTMSIPTIMYLLTSPRSDFQPFWSHEPMYVQNTPLPELDYDREKGVGFCHGILQWIRLLKEDFVD